MAATRWAAWTTLKPEVLNLATRLGIAADFSADEEPAAWAAASLGGVGLLVPPDARTAPGPVTERLRASPWSEDVGRHGPLAFDNGNVGAAAHDGGYADILLRGEGRRRIQARLCRAVDAIDAVERWGQLDRRQRRHAQSAGGAGVGSNIPEAPD